jgi:23S rRNA (cytidine1920-2'-O)/16S rRNA (cytidine1409-2'-O)-methyltransferase
MIRLDQALVDRGLCESRERAKRAILAGQVRVNAQRAHKPGDSVRLDDTLTLDAGEKYVSRGGHKLEHALRHFQLDVAGLVALDLGASTGGFTDCLLQHGAAKIFAVDVGQGQLAWKLRQDRRVEVMEKTNARYLKPEHLGGTSYTSPQSTNRQAKSGTRITRPSEDTAAFPGVDLITIDCSFISLRKILPAAIALLKPKGRMIALVKPQFEAGKAEADKGRGVINDPAIHARVLNELCEFAGAQPGLSWRGVIESPLLGPAGNKEFLVLIEKTR